MSVGPDSVPGVSPSTADPAEPPLSSPEQLKQLLGIPFTAEQLRAVTAPLAPAVIVAGAGSGKTTVMAARVVWLVGTGQVRPEQVLGLTFTNKAAGELAERVRRALVQAGVVDLEPADAEDVLGEPEISTYHSFAGRLLKEHGLRIGLEPDVRLLADATRYQLAARVLRQAPGPYPALTSGFSTLIAELLTLDGELSEHLVEPDRLQAYDTALLAELATAKITNEELRKVPRAAAARLELADLVVRYRRRKAEAGLMDFGDQIAACARLAQTRPEVGRLLREQFRVVLLDEYQDTSVAQRLLLAGLFGASDHYAGGHPVTAVGDPCQAIYGWRGASVANLDDFPVHFPSDSGVSAARYSLSENRRSGGRLLEFANTLAAPLREMHEGVEALRPAPGAERDGLLRCALLDTYDQEVAWLADSIAHLVRTGTAPGRIAVLCRAGRELFPDIHAALVARDVPVEVVGLSGLLNLPEVADLVSVCEVLQDPTANAALVRLLVGPRWRIGPRDLALLGRLAADLVRVGGADEQDRLAGAVAGTDPTEVVSLADALETFLRADRGDREGAPELPFSEEARARFARIAAEIRDLRRSLAEPLMDVLHRVLSVTGLEVELSASPHALAARRKETLNAFLDVAAGFADLDGDPSLSAFLGFLRAAQEYDRGLDNSLPGGDDTVKVLTAHRSKGLEWDVVAVPGLVKGVFPGEKGRERWTSRAEALPHELRGDGATLPGTPPWTAAGMKAFTAEMKEHAATEELRLGYVAFTRPRNLLLASGHWWGPTQKRRRGPSPFLEELREYCEGGTGGEIEAWAEAPEEDAENPSLTRTAEHPWPLPLDGAAQAARREAGLRVLAGLATAAAEPEPEPEPPEPDGWEPEPEWDPMYEEEYGAERQAAPAPGAGLAPEDQRLVAAWDRDLEALSGELLRARARVRDVPLPAALTASQVLRLAADPDGFARELARPMPRPPQPAARRGTRFHAWVESRFEPLMLLGEDDLPGADDDGIEDERDLARLKEAFLRTPYATATPYRVEAPFQLLLAGRVVRGRIDAVYRTADGGFDVVDWKTNQRETADPLQLAVYRLAWAESTGTPLEQVSAAFLYVRSGSVVRPESLPGRPELEALMSGITPNGLSMGGGATEDL
ncbi:UvrD-helicase domain-containing protein [Streptacidiphilus jeojiensis]|uniref:UvrD-helicase domain-containing protein n=1 Tax=Streptacidiphilus jeojiensis TaxID=3229225 RepID=UPI0036D3662D